MKKVIGYKFQIVSDNGDCDEWYREEHLESPLYTTENAAKRAISLAKQRMIKETRERLRKYIVSQIDFEISMNRNVNKFLCDCQRSLMSEYARVLKMFSLAEIVPVFAYDEPTEEYNEYNIAD